MKKLEFEIFSVVFSLLPLTLFFLSFNVKYSMYGVITILVAYFFEGRTSPEEEKRFLFFPRELSVIVAGIVFLPSVVTFLCFYIYDNITDAYWAFVICCWAFGSSLSGLYYALKHRQ